MVLIKWCWLNKPHHDYIDIFKRVDRGWVLVTTGPHLLERKRESKWVRQDDIHVTWIKEFLNE